MLKVKNIFLIIKFFYEIIILVQFEFKIFF